MLAAVPAPSTAGPEQIVIGVYVTQIYDMDPTGGSFSASFWLWTRHRDGNIHPLDTVEIAGAMKVESEPTLTLVKAGQVWEQKLFRAVIRYAWELREYPFDEHNFVINFEEGLYDGDSVVYVPDRVQSGIDPAAMGSRWAIGSVHTRNRILPRSCATWSSIVSARRCATAQKSIAGRATEPPLVWRCARVAGCNGGASSLGPDGASAQPFYREFVLARSDARIVCGTSSPNSCTSAVRIGSRRCAPR
ncbi:MAG TPA: hypothetical protein VGQ21_14650 [Thermoanaerobaculia bacterium]|nr:hypothetical protein [Thermoanaerobaculia bacterium]